MHPTCAVVTIVLMRTGEMVSVGVVYSTVPVVAMMLELKEPESSGEEESFLCVLDRNPMVRKTRRNHRGAGYVTSQQFFNPDVLPPHSDAAAVSTAPTFDAVRPVLNSTFKVGGFSPSVMGPFLKNAQNAIVPLALYSAYHLMPKKSRNISARKASPKSRRSRSRRNRK